MYAFHDTTAELSHGNFLTHFDAPRPRLVNVGHRDLFLTAAEAGETFEAVYPAWEIAADVAKVAAEVRAKAAAAERVWIDLDCDALDPAALPAVAEPLPFGLMPPAFLALLDAAWAGKVAGVSISEFDPGRDVRDTSLNLPWLARRIHPVEGRGSIVVIVVAPPRWPPGWPARGGVRHDPRLAPPPRREV